MEALRIVTNPKNGKIVIEMPKGLREEKAVEVIVLPFENQPEKEKKLDPRKFRGKGKLNMTADEIDRECQKLRDEWNRGF